jgi:hypothetical protein
VYEEDDDDVQQAYLPEYYNGNSGEYKYFFGESLKTYKEIFMPGHINRKLRS